MGSEGTPDRRATSPDGIVEVVRQRLRRLVADTPTPFPCRYACFIHPRRRPGERGFGVITLGGESLPLTVTMLETLSVTPTLFEGRARAVIRPDTDRDTEVAERGGSWTVPLPVTAISMQLRDGEPQVLRPTIEGPQVTLLCATRPEGWPG
jgi:hypothetical protein